MEYKTLFSPMKIGNCEIKNRIVMEPMLMGMGQLDGKATEQMMDYFEERAKGGTGLIINEITRINDSHGAGAFAQLGVSHDYQIDSIKEFADRIHRHGAKLFIQLHHPGRQNIGLLIKTVPISIACTRVMKSFPKILFKVAPGIGKVMIEKKITFSTVAPSKCEESYFAESRVRALRHSEIKKLVQQFVDGAVRCHKAGVDGVELHATHGYLIQQFLSPNTNQRTDEYGGNFENRLRFLREIVEGIRAALGDYPIIVRLSVDECYDRIGKPDKGYGLDTGIKYAKAIEAMGIDALDISSAAYDTFNYWLEPTSFELGWRKHMAAAVKKAVKIPVIAANLIRTPEQAEAQLNEGIQDFIGLGRPHIADPHFAQKAMEGRSDEIKRCICCLYCIQSMQDNAYIGTHGFCSVNPAVGKEKEYCNIQKDGNGRTVVIVGAGIGGLNAAELLSKRGFKVIVLEKEKVSGGQINLADKAPDKEKIGWCAIDAEKLARLAGADIRFETEATPELIASLKPYAVIIASGAVAVKPRSIEGVGGDNVFTTTEILDGSVKVTGKKVAVIGSGMTGLETAELLVKDGNKVTVVEMLDEIATGVWFQLKDDLLPKLSAAGTKFITAHKLISIDGKGVVLRPVNNVKNRGYKKAVKEGKPASPFISREVGEESRVDCDTVVLSLGARSVDTLSKALEGKFEGGVFVIGDAGKVGRIADATSQAYEVAMHKIK